MPACIGCNCPTIPNSPRRPNKVGVASALFPLDDPVDQKLGPEARTEVPLERLRIVMVRDPFEERDPLRLSVGEIAFEERVQDPGLREAEMPETDRELPQRL